MNNKRVWLAAAAIITIIPILSSCISLEYTGIIPEYSEQPTVVYTPAPEPSPPEPSLSPSQTLAVPDASGNRPDYDSANRPRYDIRLEYDDKRHSAAVSQTVEYTNTSADSMSELYMHIYPKHFSKKAYVDMEFMGYTAYPDDEFNPGDIEIKKVKASDRSAKFEIQGEDKTVLKVPLEVPLEKGSSITLSLEYSLKIPHRIGRFAWGDAGVSFGNWYPIMAVYDKDGWNLDKYYEIGDPFYSETADYNVTIDMPEGMEAAYTGDVVSDAVDGGRRVLSLSETGVRDFAFVLSRDYVIGSDTVDGIKVRVALPSGSEESMDAVLGYAVKSLSIYDSRFGKYTNDTFTVAFSDFFSGMEYPGLVLISADMLEAGKDMLPTIEQIVVHETAHQWWYSAVGNDEVDEAWLDEGLTSFTTLMYYSDQYGWDSVAEYWAEPIEGKALDSSLAAFSGWSDYTYVYTFGQSFFKTLMDKMGEYEFYTMLQKYYATYAYGIATADGLRSLVEETGNTDALEWYDKCVYGK